jgi:ergothioneine biosynthesis protein EgtB
MSDESTVTNAVPLGPRAAARQAASARRKGPEPRELRTRFLAARHTTEQLAAPLSAEDAAAQSMPDASPTKWHLGHTAWFFETFVLGLLPGFRAHSNDYAFMFNSYYESLGARIARHQRGLLTRPSLDEVYAYRRTMTERVATLLEKLEADVVPPEMRAATLERIELGIQHEQQHQELILTDIKHLLSFNPTFPAYHSSTNGSACYDTAPRPTPAPLGYRSVAGGLVSIGSSGEGFAFDNEGPEHLTHLGPYRLATRLVSNAEYLEFMRDGGYDRPELWLSDGFRWKSDHGVRAPLYWHEPASATPQVFTLAGLVWLQPDEPVCHVSFYEADAYARWAGARLATEAEWEHTAAGRRSAGNLLDTCRYHPRAPTSADDTQFYGDAWEWTQSAYAPYPGYRPLPGALGEYNGKFMCNQMVLKGGSCATPADHIRASYRNFFPPDARWQFTGIRLAQDA